MCHPHADGEPAHLEGVTRSDVSLPPASGEGLPARRCAPAGPTTGAVVIATDIYGANRFYKGIAERLAAPGFTALLPDVFFREGALGRLESTEPSARLRAVEGRTPCFKVATPTMAECELR